MSHLSEITEHIEAGVSALLQVLKLDPVLRDLQIPADIHERVVEYLAEVDVSSSASRQHFIDTGRYLRKGDL